jgi:hypothetical protein
LTTAARFVHGNQWVARNDHATAQEVMEPLRAVLLGVSATDLLRRSQRDCYITAAIARGRDGPLHEALGPTSTPAFGQFSWKVV